MHVLRKSPWHYARYTIIRVSDWVRESVCIYVYIYTHIHTYSLLWCVQDKHINLHALMHVCTHLHMHTYTYTYLHTHTHIHAYVSIHLHAYTTQTHTHRQTYIGCRSRVFMWRWKAWSAQRAYVHTYTHTYIYALSHSIYTSIYTHKYMHIHTYIYIHTFTNIVGLASLRHAQRLDPGDEHIAGALAHAKRALMSQSQP